MEKPTGVRIAMSAIVLAFVAAQLVPVRRTNPAVTFDIPAPDDVKAVLRRSCYDCHSNETLWPWYAYVAPASWLVAHDVHEARKELNFSTWREYRVDKRARHLEDLLEEIDEDEMPPRIYRLVHPGRSLSDAEKALLRAWVVSGRDGGDAP